MRLFSYQQMPNFVFRVGEHQRCGRETVARAQPHRETFQKRLETVGLEQFHLTLL